MKFKILAAVAVLAALLLARGMTTTTTQAAGPVAGPFDYDWNVALTNYAANSNPDISVTLSLGTVGGQASPADISFFSGATTTFAGITPSTPNLGAQTGEINFDIQTNVNGALTNNIQLPSGQPPQCGAALTTHIIAPAFRIFAANPLFTGAPNGLVATSGGEDQAPDLLNGGVAKAVTWSPDWYPTVMGALGVPQSVIIGRSYGISTTGTGHTSVNFITVNALGGKYVQVTVLSNPIAAFSPTAQIQSTCPPFTSNVHQFANTTAFNWNCDHDVFGNLAAVPGCGGNTTGGTSTIIKVSGTTGNTYDFAIALSMSADLDSDIAGNGNHLYNEWDNCRINSNGGQADSNNDGIGDACAGGGAWVNSDPAAVAFEAGPGCNNSDAAHTASTNPLALSTCQDPDGDGVLSSVDNCPLVANATQQDTDRDGIGDACDPQPLVPGTGTGYSAAPVYFDVSDICNHPFTVGTGQLANSCTNRDAAVHFRSPSSDGYPDFWNPGTNACVQDHKGDANKDGYSDSDESGQWNATGTQLCTSGVFPAKATVPAAQVLHDPLGVCAGRAPVVVGGVVVLSTNGKKASGDLNLDGKVNLLDLGAAAGWFGQSTTGNTDQRSEGDQNGDGKVNLLDLGQMAGFFGQTVPAC